jgi:ribosomal protein S27E
LIEGQILATLLQRAFSSGNFVRFFILVRQAPYLLACLAHIYFGQVTDELCVLEAWFDPLSHFRYPIHSCISGASSGFAYTGRDTDAKEQYRCCCQADMAHGCSHVGFCRGSEDTLFSAWVFSYHSWQCISCAACEGRLHRPTPAFGTQAQFADCSQSTKYAEVRRLPAMNTLFGVHLSMQVQCPPCSQTVTTPSLLPVTATSAKDSLGQRETYARQYLPQHSEPISLVAAGLSRSDKPEG